MEIRIPLLAVVLLSVLGGQCGFGVPTLKHANLRYLPQPNITIRDQVGDASALAGDCPGGCVRFGWYDIKEVRGYDLDDGIAFAIQLSGSLPRFFEDFAVYIDVDGVCSRIGANLNSREAAFSAGYEYALGYFSYGLRARALLVDLSADDTWYIGPQRVAHWSRGDTSYFEATWEQLGGKRESISFMVVVMARNEFGCSYVRDLAPDRGIGTLEVSTES